MKNLLIFGTGQTAELAHFYFSKFSNEYKVVAFSVDAQYIVENTFKDLPILPLDNIKHHYDVHESDFFVALSYNRLNKLRQEKYMEIKALGFKLASYVSPQCTFLSDIEPGDNCFIFENNTIQPFVRIGNNVVLWSGNHIGHHSVIEDHNFISSHVVISGNCHIKSFSFIGVNATIHNHIIIEEENIIGAGSIIRKSTRKGDVYLPSKSTLFAKRSSEINL